MKILVQIGMCSQKKRELGIQFIDNGGTYAAAGTFTPNGAGDAKKKEDELKGKFCVDSRFKCKFCGQKYIYQCGFCKTFICYDGKARRDVECPKCGKKSDVPEHNVQGYIMASGTPKNAIHPDILLAIDTSGSMAAITQRVSRLDEVKQAAVSQFINVFDGKCRMGLIKFESNVRLLEPLTDNMSEVRAKLSQLRPEGGTYSPLNLVLEDSRLASFRNSNKPRYLVVLTDGAWFEDADMHYRRAEDIKRLGIQIITVGCTGADHRFLDRISSGGASIKAEDGAIEAAIATVAKKINNQ